MPTTWDIVVHGPGPLRDETSDHYVSIPKLPEMDDLIYKWQHHLVYFMKVNVSDEEWRLLDSAVLRGALEGASASAALAIPSFYYLHRKSAWYRSLPLPLRVAGVVMVVAPFTSIQAERRSLEFERRQWWAHVWVGPNTDHSPDHDRSDSGKLELDRAAAHEEARFNALSTTDKALDWATRHQYSIILGSWALSMATAGAIVAKDKYVALGIVDPDQVFTDTSLRRYLTLPQKVI